MLMWIIFVVCSGYTLYPCEYLSFRINTTFIEIFVSSSKIGKYIFWKVYITRNAICRKIKVSDIYVQKIVFILESS